MKIFLIGYRATGKSTVGRILSGRLKVAFCDTDTMVEQTAGMPIKEIVALEGWPSFRMKEKDAVQSLDQKDSCVVATGGGVILNSENVDFFKRSGLIIWLNAPLQDIVERLKRDALNEAKRPQFTAGNIIQETTEMMKQRFPLYESAADYTVDTFNKNPEQIVEETYQYLRKSGFLDKITQTKN
ncbi:MAG: shikimate kinase AroL [Smithella sp.]